MAIEYLSETNIGNKRRVNEDSRWPETLDHSHGPADPYGMLFVVADGMGGHGAGDVASKLAVQTISATYYDQNNEYTSISDRLRLAIETAHQKISERASESPDYENMGTTVVAVVIKYDEVYEQGELWVAWAGDSRVYMQRLGQLQQLTKDHSRIWPLLESGQLTWDEARFHPERSRVTNALAAHRPIVEPEVEHFDLEPGDQILLCSDGLAGEVRPEEIEQILSTYPPSQAIHLLIDKANSPTNVYKDGKLVRLDGGNDNITSILITIPTDDPQFISSTTTLPALPAVAATRSRPRFSCLIAGIFLLLILAGAGLLVALFGWGATLLGSPSSGDQVSTFPTAIVVNADTPLPAANVVVIEQTATSTPQPSLATEEVEPALDEARTPTVTRGPVTSPTLPPPTFTPIPPTETPFVIPTGVLTALLSPTEFSPPILLQPKERGQGQVGQENNFVWQWSGGELPKNYGFEIRMWLEGNEPTGVYDAKELKQLLRYNPNEDHTYSVTLKLEGATGIYATDANYLWSVGIVQLEPYEWLDIESEARRISIIVPDRQ